ncbi:MULTISPECIES: hypothetical protein [unclassified Lysobacter]|uniref:hypothetical protein n=1 Tax=unclassified Lysobacter TaxID=2635362 RepID=UPI001BEA3479|nr:MULTISPECIES: hypothetical protein [unclassified Lysobacter]MBT2750089.1 hypothetical protein [Lysobacter sp. ISL-50]MBT2775339.1 hypothetical protein [Lysobacter sp. ISL-54]MBT2783462.1 hypothetical protein [Lysobacter sp. ISL-52]
MNTIDDFFAKYEEGANSFDPDLLASQYTDCFMSADPKSTFCIRNDTKLREAAIEREKLFHNLGFKFAKIIGKDVTRLDDNYTMVKVHWHLRFDNPSAKQSDFKFFNTYFLSTTGALKVVFYISHDDEQKVMKDAGLVPIQAK